MTATSETGGLPAVTPSTTDDSPLVAAEATPGWFVSLVPPPDSLPLEVDLRGRVDPVPLPPARSAADDVVRPVAPLPPGLSPRPGGGAVAAAPAPATERATPPRSTRERVRSLWRCGLPTPAVLGAAALTMLPGVVLDLQREGSLGRPSAVFFVLAAAGIPLLLRARSLAVGVVLPPLLFAAAAGVIAWRSGLNHGTRQIGLDVGTTMAVNAPLLFAGTAVALTVVAGRLVVRLARR